MTGPRGRSLAVYFLLSVGIGILVSVLLSRGEVSLRTIGVGAVVGAVVFLFAYGFGFLAEPWCRRLPKGFGSAALAAVYALGGTAGSLLGLVLGRTLVLGLPLEFPSASGLAIVPLICAVLALLVALPARAYEGMKARLSESIERLKAAEYAEKELELARAIQQRLLPPASLSGPGFAVAARNVPARHVGGDFYDIFRLEEGKIGLAVADVAGKGMGAALIMATAKAVVPLLAAGRVPTATLSALSTRLRRELSRREFVAIAYGLYDAPAGRLTLVNAGLPDPYLVRRGLPPRPLSCPGPRFPLGLREGIAYEELIVVLEPGDRVVFLTDGLPEAPGPGGEPLGYAVLEGLLRLPDGGTPEDVLELVLKRVLEAASGPLEDDATLLVLERTTAVASA